MGTRMTDEKKWNCSGIGITVAEVSQLPFISGRIKSNWRTSATVIPFPEQFHFFFISHSCTHLLDSKWIQFTVSNEIRCQNMTFSSHIKKILEPPIGVNMKIPNVEPRMNKGLFFQQNKTSRTTQLEGTLVT